MGCIFCLRVVEHMLGPGGLKVGGGLIIKRQCTVFASKGIFVSDQFRAS